MRHWSALCLFATLLLLLFVQADAQAKMVYRIGGRVCSKQEYRGAELAEEGHRFLNAGRLSEAAERLQRAAALAPEQCYIQSNLALVLIKLGHPEEAIPYLKNAVKLQKGNAESVRSLSSAYVASGNLTDALSVLEQYTRKHSSGAGSQEIEQYCKELKKELLAQSKVDPSQRSAEDYFAFTTAEEGSVRWESQRTPLKVFVNPAENIRGYQPGFASELQQAFQSWEQASNGKIRFVAAAAREQADITVTWTDNVADLDSPDEGGEARVKFGSKGVTHSDIFILTHNDTNDREGTPNQIYGVCLHEIGHSLGLLNHSPDAHDVMYFSDRNSVKRPELSLRDKNTLELLYKTEQAYIPKPGSADAIACRKIELFNGAVSDYNAAKYVDAEQKCEALLKLEPDSRTSRLLADALDNHAAACMEQHDYSGAEPLVRHALEIRRAIGDSDVYDTLYNYGIVLRGLHKDAEAEVIEREALAARVISRN